MATTLRADMTRTETAILDPLPLTPSGMLLRQYITEEGFANHHIQVFDHWISENAAGNVSSRILTFPDGRSVAFENLRILPPRYTRDGKTYRMSPKFAREQGVTYGSDWHCDAIMRNAAGVEIDRRSNICIGTVPTMLKSSNCILHGMSRRDMAIMGEDPDDPGGYFIVNGAEKVILLQEQLAINKIFLMLFKDSVVARFTASTPRGTALITLALDKRTSSIVKMKFPAMKSTNPNKKLKSLNVLRIFRILGTTEIQDIQNKILAFVRPEHAKKCSLKLLRSIIDFSAVTDDVEIIASKLDKTKLSFEDKMKEIARIFEADLFPHLNVMPLIDGETNDEYSRRVNDAKLNLLSIMIARLLEYMAGFRKVDDRDSWSNKRVEGAGRMMEQLFRNAWRKSRGAVQELINDGRVKDLTGVVGGIRYSVVTDTFIESFITSNWGVKGSQMKNNVAQTLVRDSVVATQAHMNTVDVSISRTDRQQALRLVQPSQWYKICPASTPEGENAGLVKNLSLTARVTVEHSDDTIIRLLIGDPEAGIAARVSPNYDPALMPMMVNGKFLGWCNGAETRNFLVHLRRTGELPLDMSVIIEENWLYVDISPSRLVHPVLIVNADQTLAIDTLELRGQANDVLLKSGAMEYMSAWEQEYIKVAARAEDIAKRTRLFIDADDALRSAENEYQAVLNGEVVTRIIQDTERILSLEDVKTQLDSAREAREKLNSNAPYTHCEIDPTGMLGVAAALIPWPDHNQAPRNTYQVSMSKQALGEYHSNHLNRFDGKTKVLAFPHRPMVESMMYDVLGLDERGPGENVNIAFMALPFTEEDSFVFKKEFLDNGGFRIMKFLTYKTVVKQTSIAVETLAKPTLRVGENPDRYKYIQQFEHGNPMNGLPMIGAPLRQGDCVIGKIQHKPNTLGKGPSNESSILRVGDEGVVEKVLVTSDNKTTIVTVKLRVMRIPQEGDKFAPRNAQKGTIGLVVSDIDLPATASGIAADIYVNPHSMPSRMTMSYPMECIAAKYAAMKGQHINGGAFHPFELNKYRAGLKDYGLDEMGYETMRSGLSGKLLEAPIYSSLCYFQALKHHVKDKVQARSSGPVKPMTRQPPKGRGNNGGLRFGEMERDAAISHGASSFLLERLMHVSDGYQTAFCAECGTFAVNDENTKQYRACKICGNSTKFGRATIPYAYKLLIHLLAAAGMFLRPEFMTSEDYIEKVLNTRGELGHGEVEDIQNQLAEADLALEEEQQEDIQALEAEMPHEEETTEYDYGE